MDHNLDDALKLEGDMGVDFDHSEDTVVNHADISLDATSHEENIPMEYESIEEQSMLMDTGSEEIIDFIGDQFALQDYSQEVQVSSKNIIIESKVNESVSSHIPYGCSISVPASGVITEEEAAYMNVNLPKVIAVKAAHREVSAGGRGAPRPVAIAPKPVKLVTQGVVQKMTLGPKQYAIAPKPLRPGVKPVTLLANKPMQQNAKGNTILAIGKQLVMMPGGHKIKLMAGKDSAQLIQNVSTSQAQGNKVTKVIVQGSSSDGHQPAVITKLVSVSAPSTPSTPSPSLTPSPAPARVVTLQQKPNNAVPITIGNKKVVLASPSKQNIVYSSGRKPQLIAIKSPALAPATTAPTNQGLTKKIVTVPTNSTQNVILKATPKTGSVTNVVASSTGPKTQLHQINVPGKGIQYIRLVTNPVAKTTPKTQAATPPTKTFVLADGKGNLIQMTAEKVSQPPPLIVTGNVTNSQVPSKPPQKLVRLAPVSSKLGQAAMHRGGQSLLAPLSPIPAEAQPTRASEDFEFMEGLVQQEHQSAFEQHQLAAVDHQAQLEEEAPEEDTVSVVKQEPHDSKAALRALIADTVGSIESDNAYEAADQQAINNAAGNADSNQHYDSSHDQSDSNSGGAERGAAGDHPLIVIPPYLKPTDHADMQQHGRRLSALVSVDVEVDAAPYHTEHRLDDADTVPGELDARARKPCNCTKSQCLKLYCDCFANGEFCNNCNCNNCHNNLENEELRQKAIRGCLDRNPKAFRPKIGKSRAGPENFRRHNRGCNCKRSGCLKNYCECYEAKIACTNICKCVGCRNVEESLERARRRDPPRVPSPRHPHPPAKQPCSFMTSEVIEAVCQCLIAAAVDSGAEREDSMEERDPISDVIDEFARCLQDIISASHQAAPIVLFDEAQA